MVQCVAGPSFHKGVGTNLGDVGERFQGIEPHWHGNSDWADYDTVLHFANSEIKMFGDCGMFADENTCL